MAGVADKPMLTLRPAIGEFFIRSPALTAITTPLPTRRDSTAFLMRATDRAGNVTETTQPVQVRIDQDAPTLTLDTPANIATQTVISSPITLGGTVNEPGAVQAGIASAEIAFTRKRSRVRWVRRSCFWAWKTPAARRFSATIPGMATTVCAPARRRPVPPPEPPGALAMASHLTPTRPSSSKYLR